MSEPASRRRRMMRGNGLTVGGSGGAPTRVRVASRFRSARRPSRSWRRGDGVEDEVEAVRVARHLVRVARDDDVRGAQAARVLALAGRRREQDDLGAEGVRQLHAHVTQAAEADDPDLLALAGLPVTQRRVGGDPRAEERRHARGIEPVGDPQHEVLVDHDALRVAAVGDAAQVLVGAVVRPGEDRRRRTAPAPRGSWGSWRQESTMQPTAASPPGLNRFTSAPTSTTRPTISWPGTHG